MSDQHSPRVMGCAGDAVVRTPNLDRLAANGTLFEHCYTPAPLCAPARASFMTSRYPSGNEVWGNGCWLPSDVPTFAHSLGACGYETALVGRMHFNGPDQRHGFEKRLVGDLTGPYSGCGVPCLNAELLSSASGRKPVQISGPGRTAYQLFDETVTESAVEYLKARRDDRPLCMVVGYVLPHCPLICPPEDFDYYCDRVSLPLVPDGYFEFAHPSVIALRNRCDAGEATDEQIRCARAGYYGLVAHLDRQIGRLLQALQDRGLLAGTVVMYTSDHGDSAGEHGLWGKNNYFEDAASVPLIVSWPGHFPSGSRIPELVNLVDIGPTLIDSVGAPALPDAVGRSLLPLVGGESADWVNETFSELGPFAGLPPSRMIRRDNWKLIHYDGLSPMLFDLVADPNEFDDRAADPSVAHIREELTRRVTDGWNPRLIRETLARRDRMRPIRVAWFNAVHPPTPEQWTGPEGANEYRIGK